MDVACTHLGKADKLYPIEYECICSRFLGAGGGGADLEVACDETKSEC